MKNKKYTIAAIVLIILLGLGTYALIHMHTEPEQKAVTKEIANSYTVFAESAENVASVEVISEDFNIKTVNNGDSDWTIDGEDENNIDPSKAYALAATVTNLTSSEKYDNIKNLDEYGLETPSLTVKIIRKNGAEDMLYIGDKSPVSGEYFIKRSGDDSVYTMHSYKFDTLIQPVSYYTEFNRLDEINPEDIIRVRIEREEDVIELKQFDEIDKYTLRVWEMISPYQSPANDDYVDDKILQKITEISLNMPVDEEIGEQTAKLSFRVTPYNTLSGEYDSEYEETLIIGKTVGDETYVSHKNKTYKVPSDTVSFVRDSAFNIVSKKQLLVNISLVKALIVEYNDVNSTIAISRDNDNKYNFKLDGKDVSRSETQDIYTAIADLSADGVYGGGEIGETILKLTYEGYDNADNTTIEIKQIDNVNCAIVRNGKTDFTIRKSKIETFMNNFDSYLEKCRN